MLVRVVFPTAEADVGEKKFLSRSMQIVVILIIRLIHCWLE